MNGQKKPKKSINAFSCFMIKFRDKQAAKGIKYANMREVCENAKIEWMELSQSEKDLYKEEAKIQKKIYQVTRPKLTQCGVPINQLVEKQKAENAHLENLKMKIEEDIQSHVHYKTLLDKEVYIISTTDYCQTYNGDIFPAELALVKFSLRSGVKDSLHMFINPGELPLGYADEAQAKSDAEHQLPLPPNTNGISNYYTIYTKIMDFINQGYCRDVPVLFTHSKELTTARLTINKILQEADSNVKIGIYPIEFMFSPLKKYIMRLKVKDKNCSVKADHLVIKDIIDRDSYDYTIGIGCEFHDEVDFSFHCNLSKAKRWCFSFSDYCYKDLRGTVDYILGQHLPASCDISALEKAVKEEEKRESEKLLIDFEERVEAPQMRIRASRLADVFRNACTLNDSTASIFSFRESMLQESMTRPSHDFTAHNNLDGLR